MFGNGDDIVAPVSLPGNNIDQRRRGDAGKRAQARQQLFEEGGALRAALVAAVSVTVAGTALVSFETLRVGFGVGAPAPAALVRTAIFDLDARVPTLALPRCKATAILSSVVRLARSAAASSTGTSARTLLIRISGPNQKAGMAFVIAAMLPG